MNAPVPHTTLINPFALPARATLADVAERVSSSTLSFTRKRDCLSALRRVGHLLDQDLTSISAEVGPLRERLASLNPARFGLSAHTWSNLRSNLFRAIEVSGLWNRLVDRTAHERDLRRLDLPSRRPAPTRVPWESLPASFRSDVEEHLAWASGQDPFAPDPRPRPLSPGSIRLRRQFIQSAVTALVAAGTPVQDITSLGALVTPEAFKSILRQRHKEADQQANAYNEALAKALVGIAREWVEPDAPVLSELKRLSSKLPRLAPGLTDKNTSLLRAFADPNLLGRLVALPDQLWQEALRQPPSSRQFAKAQAALAIAILTYAPLRIANLSALAFDQTLFVPPRASQESLIEIPAAQMKNREPFTMALPARITAMLQTYRSAILKPLVNGSPVFVFDDGHGKPKLPTTVSWLIERTIKRHLGIRMTAHQFRHLAAKVILDGDAGAYETVRQLLGHRNLKTTVNSYAGRDTLRAGRRHAALIEQELAQQVASKPPSRRRPRVRQGG